MLNNKGWEANVVPWRRIRAALPAVVLIAAGITFAAPVAPRNIASADVSKHSPAIVVPDTPLTMPAVGGPGWTGPFAVPDSTPPAVEPPVGSTSTLMPPAGSTSSDSIASSSSTPAVLDSTGIPARALDAYRKAATLVQAADPACNIDWALLAAIGRVESNHARFGGNQLDPAGVAQPGIIGIPLDGTNGTALIKDTDGGQWDGDTVYDRAVGPMQFIPGTWRAVGVDGDGDGVKNPQDMADAATSAAVYLCSGPGDLTRPGDLHSAIMRYNPSESYVATVTSIADTYRHGVTALPASYLPPVQSAHPSRDVATAARIHRLHAHPAPATAGAAQAASVPVTPAAAVQAPDTPAPAAPAPATPPASTPPPSTPPLQVAPVPGAPAPAPAPGCLPNPGTPTPATPVPDPSAPVPAASSPAAPCPTTPPTPCQPGPATPVPATPVPATPVPTTPAPAPDPAIPAPATPEPATCQPVPTPPTPAVPGSCPPVPDPAAPTPGLTPTAGTPASTPPTQQVCTTAP
jgi:membrane-bound lytic murein transglycosylase B